MSAINIDVPKNDPGIQVANKSVDRLKERHTEANRNPGVFTGVLRIMALLAAIGTILNVTFEVADSFKNENR
jgi:hypothetical protein